MPLSVQIAFQGGGAKLPALIAVVHALIDKENEGLIEVKRVSGTSAGSIAAVILASKPKNFQSVLNEFKKQKNLDLLKELSFKNESVFLLLWKLYRGKPFREFEPIKAIIRKVLKKISDEPLIHIKDLEAKTLICYSSMENSKSMVFDDEEEILTSIEHSCAIPYFFRTWKDSFGKVDGGLGGNLPVHHLLKQDDEITKSTKTLAVSFRSKESTKINSNIKFLTKLIDVSISGNEALCKSLINKNDVFEIDTELSTFSFLEAFNTGFDSSYDEVYEKASNWIDCIIEEEEARTSINPDYWSDPSVQMKELMNDNLKLFHHITARDSYQVKNLRFEIFAWSLSEDDHPYPDIATLEFEFKVLSEKLYGLKVCFFGTSEQLKFTQNADYEIFNSKGKIIESISLPISDIEADSRAVGIFFKEPLEKGNEFYCLKYEEKGYEMLGDVKSNGKEEFNYQMNKNSGLTGNIIDVRLIAYVPGNVSLKIDQEGVESIGRELNSDEIKTSVTQKLFPKLTCCGWLCEELDYEKGCLETWLKLK